MRSRACALAIIVACAGVCVPLDAASLGGDVFVVDPGHGTRFPSGAPLNVGAVGSMGVKEEDVVLEVAEDLAALLQQAGARVVLTRSHQHRYRTANDRAKDNRARAALANSLGATAFIAVHADSSLERSQRGFSIFWLRNNSLALARAIRARLQPLGIGEGQFHRRHLAVTDEAKVPAALVELGFVSNPIQERQLASVAFQHRLAAALFAAILDAFGRT